MKTNSNALTTISALVISIVCASSHASINWYWNFDQTVYTVTATDVIMVTATLFNEPSSDGNLMFGSGVGASFTGDMQSVYNFTFGRPGENFGDEFLSLNVAAGESFHFT